MHWLHAPLFTERQGLIFGMSFILGVRFGIGRAGRLGTRRGVMVSKFLTNSGLSEGWPSTVSSRRREVGA